jgi:hypothetical protein
VQRQNRPGFHPAGNRRNRSGGCLPAGAAGRRSNRTVLRRAAPVVRRDVTRLPCQRLVLGRRDTRAGLARVGPNGNHAAAKKGQSYRPIPEGPELDSTGFGVGESTGLNWVLSRRWSAIGRQRNRGPIILVLVVVRGAPDRRRPVRPLPVGSRVVDEPRRDGDKPLDGSLSKRSIRVWISATSASTRESRSSQPRLP